MTPSIVAFLVGEIQQKAARTVQELREVAQEYPGCRPLIRRLLESSDLCIERAFGTGVTDGAGERVGYRPNPADTLEYLNWIMHFVCHELNDDGSPGIAYARFATGGRRFLLCRESDPGALPVVVCNYDPFNYRSATARSVIAVLDRHESEEQRVIARAMSRYTPAEVEAYRPHEPSAHEVQRRILAKELGLSA